MLSGIFLKIIAAIGILVSVISFVTAQGRPSGVVNDPGRSNAIQGTVFDDSRNPVYNAFIELYSNMGQLVGRERSSSQGRFIFRGMLPGRYVLKVKPFGTNLQEDSEDIEVGSSFLASDIVNQDFHLQKDKRFLNEQTSIVGAVYAQEVPEKARSLFKSGVDNLHANHTQALADLEEAVKVFPTYFDALAALGKAYILDAKYEQGYPYLLRAVDVNRRCGDCFYSLALAFYKLNEIAAGVKAANAAALLQPQVPAVKLLQGILLFLDQNYAEAEKALLAAKSLFAQPDADVYWYLSLTYNKTNRNLQAADALEEYLKVKPKMDQVEKNNVRELIKKLRK